MPLTLSGKVDRDALPAPHREREPSAHAALEARLAQIVAELLEADEIAPDEDLRQTENPLPALLLIDRIEQVFGITLTREQLYAAATITGSRWRLSGPS